MDEEIEKIKLKKIVRTDRNIEYNIQNTHARLNVYKNTMRVYNRIKI